MAESDNFDTVDGACPGQADREAAEVIHARKSTALTLSSRGSPIKKPNSSRVDSARGEDFGSGDRLKGPAQSDDPSYRRSPIAIAFASAMKSGEFSVENKSGSGDATPQKSIVRALREELVEKEAAAVNSKQKPFRPTPGPIYMPASAEYHPPIRSSLMKNDSVKDSPVKSPFLLIKRRSQSYVDSAARYSPSPVKGSPSPVKEKISQLEQKTVVQGSRAVSPCPVAGTKVKELVARFDPDSPTANRCSQSPLKLNLKAVDELQLEPSSFESTLNLQVTSPQVLQKSVCVMEMDSPVKVLKAYKSSEDKSSDVGKEGVKPVFDFTFSKPLEVMGDDRETSEEEPLCSVEEEPIIKTVAGDGNRSLLTSFNDQFLSFSTLDQSCPSDKTSLPPYTDDSSLAEEWGPESGVEYLSDLRTDGEEKLAPIAENCEETDLAEDPAPDPADNQDALLGTLQCCRKYRCFVGINKYAEKNALFAENAEDDQFAAKDDWDLTEGKDVGKRTVAQNFSVVK